MIKLSQWMSYVELNAFDHWNYGKMDRSMQTATRFIIYFKKYTLSQIQQTIEESIHTNVCSFCEVSPCFVERHGERHMERDRRCEL